MAKPTLEIDGTRFDDLDGFYAEVSRLLTPGVFWGRNLDAFNDVLRGGFGTPEGGFVLRWTSARRSRERLGYDETIRHLERKLARCHPQNRSCVMAELDAAKARRGPTIFDVLVEIIETHGPGGREADDGVELRLVD